jgi:hypothetical protein
MELTREFVSFPKSGRTWLRYALTLAGVADSIRFHHDGFEYNDGSLPSLDFDFEARLRRCVEVDRLVYLHRDPRDVIVSLYVQITGRFRDFFRYEGSLSEFIRDPYFGVQNLAEFQRQWDDICTQGKALRITYEQCHVDFETVLRSILSYYEFTIGKNSLASICQKSSFRKMQRAEDEDILGQPWLRKRNGCPKVRRGAIGGFESELSEKDVVFLNESLRFGDNQNNR